MEDTPRRSEVRKRAPTACVRCRQQKIKCSGRSPCEQCSRRQLSCTFDNKQQKVLVSRSFLDSLQRQAASSSGRQWTLTPRTLPLEESGPQTGDTPTLRQHERRATPISQLGVISSFDQASASHSPSILVAEPPEAPPRSDSEEPDPDAVPAAAEAHLDNPLTSPHTQRYTADSHGKSFYFGTSSNWSFGRRILSMAHERVSDEPLETSSLLFEASTYDLGWDGQRDSHYTDAPILPTPDFALYLINSVKFHCGQLYHLFDELTFMENFNQYHENTGQDWSAPILWYIHYLIILAFGKAFVVRTHTGPHPPGGEFFVHAMKLLPHTTFLCGHPLEAIEVLSCAALYLQCLDYRTAAYNLIGQAARIALDQGMHTDVQSRHVREDTIERRREAWWTVYVLDRQMSSLLGCSVAFSDEDVTTRLPSFSGSVAASRALAIHVKLCQAATMILQTVYGRGSDKNKRLLVRMKEALKTIANANDERNHYFPLNLKRDAAISRVSAHLHLFHHQCIILATRPLMFSFWQKRLHSVSPLRVTSAGGGRSMLRVCVGSAQQSINILTTLQSQSLLESFLPFDLEAVFTSTIVLCLANAVDSSLLQDKGPWLQASFAILDEMISRGNLIAGFHRSELQQLDEKLNMLPATPRSARTAQDNDSVRNRSIAVDEQRDHSINFSAGYDPLLSEWTSDEDLTGDQIMALADALDFNAIDFGESHWLGNDMSAF